MENVSLPYLQKGDTRLELTVENRIRNIFVTQAEETREEENVNYIPVITETASRVLETGVNTLQKTLVLKKQVELGEVERLLELKRQEFRGHMKAFAQRAEQLELKQRETQDKAKRFERFVQDNEAKRRRALKKYQVTKEQNYLKQREIEDLTGQLKKLQVRQKELKRRVAKYKIYENYLMRMIDYIPADYIENGTDSLVMPIIRRHETLSITNQGLVQSGGELEEQLERGHRQLKMLKQKHITNQLMANKELSELQSEWDVLKEQNKRREINMLMDQGQLRDKAEELASLLLAMKNLGEQCFLQSYGPLGEMDLLSMMDMVEEYILEKADTEKKAIKLLECGSPLTSSTDSSLRKDAESLKKINNKTQLKSQSKASRKSGISTF